MTFSVFYSVAYPSFAMHVLNYYEYYIVRCDCVFSYSREIDLAISPGEQIMHNEDISNFLKPVVKEPPIQLKKKPAHTVIHCGDVACA